MHSIVQHNLGCCTGFCHQLWRHTDADGYRDLQDQFLHLLRSHLSSEAAATAAARNLASLAAWAHRVRRFSTGSTLFCAL